MASAPVISAAAIRARNVEVALARGGRADADGLVGESHVQRFAVGLGVDGDGLDAELAAGADDAQGDLAAIGDQDFLEQWQQAEGRRRWRW